MPDPLDNVDEQLRRVYAYVAYRLGDGPDAEDVTSTTIERALRYRGGFDPARGDAVPWLLGIARRCIADFHRQRSREQPEHAAEPTQPGPEEGAPARVDLQRVMLTLPERDRELLALRYGADLTAREIGRLVGMRTNAVEVALHRSLRVLRTELDREQVDRVLSLGTKPEQRGEEPVSP